MVPRKLFSISALVLIILLVGFFLRIAELFNAFDYLTAEPSIDYMAAKSVAVDHIIPTMGYVHGGHLSFAKVLWNLALAIPFLISGGHPFSLKVFMFLVSCTTLLVSYPLFRKIIGKRAALLSTFLMSFSPLLIEYSGKISPPLVLPLISVFIIYSVAKILNGRTNFIYLYAFLTSTVLHFEVPAGILLLVQFLATSAYLLYRKSISYKRVFIALSIITFTSLPVFAFSIAKNIQGFLQISNSKLTFTEVFLSHFISYAWNFRATLSPNPILASLILITILLGIYFFYKAKPKNQKIQLWLFSSPFLFFLLSLLYQNPLSGWWLSFLTIYWCLILGICFDTLVKHRKITAIPIVVLLLIIFYNRTHSALQTRIIFPPTTDVIRTKEAAAFIISDANGKPFNYEVLSHWKVDGNPYYFDAIFWWLGKRNETAAENTYIILEPDFNANLDLKPLKEFDNGIGVYKKPNN